MGGVTITKIGTGPGFMYNGDPQGSPSWIETRVGRITASRLSDWLAVSKRPNKDGVHTPLKARTDYGRELSFEIQFGVPFSKFQTAAMEQGIVMEEVVKTRYAQEKGIEIKPAGVFYNEVFAASPDGLIGNDGLIEVKWLYDTAFMDVLTEGVPENYMLQMQGQLWATGRKWVDFVVANGNTNTYKVIRVKRDEEIIKRIQDSLTEENVAFPVIDTDDIYDLGVASVFAPSDAEWNM